MLSGLILVSMHKWRVLLLVLHLQCHQFAWLLAAAAGCAIVSLVLAKLGCLSLICRPYGQYVSYCLHTTALKAQKKGLCHYTTSRKPLHPKKTGKH